MGKYFLWKNLLLSKIHNKNVSHGKYAPIETLQITTVLHNVHVKYQLAVILVFNRLHLVFNKLRLSFTIKCDVQLIEL